MTWMFGFRIKRSRGGRRCYDNRLKAELQTSRLRPRPNFFSFMPVEIRLLTLLLG